MNLADILRGEVAGARSPVRSDEKRGRGYDEKTMVEEGLVRADPDISSKMTGKKSGRILVPGETRCAAP